MDAVEKFMAWPCGSLASIVRQCDLTSSTLVADRTPLEDVSPAASVVRSRHHYSRTCVKDDAASVSSGSGSLQLASREFGQSRGVSVRIDVAGKRDPEFIRVEWSGVPQ